MAGGAAYLQGRAFWEAGLVVQQGQQILQLPVQLGKAAAQEAEGLLHGVIQL